MTKPNKKTEQIPIRFSPEMRDAIERAAVAEHRSLSDLMRIIVIEWLRSRHYYQPGN